LRIADEVTWAGKISVNTESTAWDLDAPFWNPLWTREETMKKGMPILKKAGFESVEDLRRTAVGFSSKAYKNLPPQLKERERLFYYIIVQT